MGNSSDVDFQFDLLSNDLLTITSVEATGLMVSRIYDVYYGTTVIDFH